MNSNRKIPVSVTIIAFNEEKRIGDCLESVRDFEEIVVVVDAKTIDRTAELCRKYGCRVFVEEWEGFGPQKQSAVEKCSKDWVLILDADERLPSETVAVIEKTLQNPDASNYSLKMRHFFHGRWIKFAGHWPDRHVRLVKKTGGSFQGMIHEKWITNGTFQELDAAIDHFGFSCYSDLLVTLNEYWGFGNNGTEIHVKAVVKPQITGFRITAIYDRVFRIFLDVI